MEDLYFTTTERAELRTEFTPRAILTQHRSSHKNTLDTLSAPVHFRGVPALVNLARDLAFGRENAAEVCKI
jgi:hypothetical protein